MSRKQTNGGEHLIVDEGRTGRIVGRRALRTGLGNPKKRKRDLAQLLFEMFMKGVQQGKTLENTRITYATAGMDYPEEYNVQLDHDVLSRVPDSSDLHSKPSAMVVIEGGAAVDYVAPTLDDAQFFARAYAGLPDGNVLPAQREEGAVGEE
jgi:hypothetical protein